MFLDPRDSAHNNAFMAIAHFVKNNVVAAKEYIDPVYNILFKDNVWWIKNPTYKWSNCDGWRNVIYAGLD